MIGVPRRRALRTFTLAFAWLFSCLTAGAQSIQSEGRPVTAPNFRVLTHPAEHRLQRGRSFEGDVRTLPQIPPEKFERPEFEQPEITPVPYPGTVAVPETGAALVTSGGPAMNPPAPSASASFDGLDFTNFGAGHPPDTNGDVGPTHYIQTINTSVGIYRKSDGVRLAGFTFNTLMNGHFGNLCDTNNFGDPVVVYDTFEDRWIITDFAFQLSGGNPVAPEFQCFAVSKSGDPVSGGWNFYSIQVNGAFGDYPKFGIWPDGLYMSANDFGFGAGGSFQNVRVWAFNKAQMYAGNPTVQVLTFDAPSAEFTLLPSNARLQTGTPPAGSPNYFAVVWQFLNAVSVYKFHVDWNNISTSTFSGPFISNTSTWWAQYSDPNGTAPSPNNALDTLYPRLMVQNQYTNIGGVESLWNSHTVGAGNPTSNVTSAQAAVRYYQVKVTGGSVEANATQSFTYSPDTTVFRFMPSVAVDRAGDMAIGYSASSGTLNPAIRYAGRLAGDAVNSITQTETTLIAGTGSQSGNCGPSACTRWGDYSAMTLDPNGCTFWYTNMYYVTTGLAFNTRIGAFSFPSCTPVATGTLSGTVTAAGSGTPISGATVALGSRTTTTNASGNYSFSGLPSGTYPSITASFPGFNSATVANIVVNDASTTTQNFSLTAAPTSGCLTDTSQADFQAGVPTNCDLTSSPGNVTLLNATNIDQQNGSVTNNGFGFTSTSWAGQTFTPAVTGQLTRVDLDLFCSTCTGTTPNITVSIRATTGATPVPTGSDLATATITGFSSGAGGFFTANFSSPPTLTAGTRYAVIFRAVSNPSAGTYAYVCSCSGGGAVDSNPYANGQRVTSNNSGTTWIADTTVGGRDLGFKAYMQSGFATSGTFVSSAKDANPASGATAHWGTLSWTASTPVNTAIQFQAAASNNISGPFNFVGPDGTAGTFFTNGGSLAQFNGSRYLKYQASLTTTNTATTPTLNDVTVCFSNSGATSPPTISKAFGTASIPLNGSTSLSFTINNPNAGSSLSGVGFSDTLPSGLVIATPNGLTGSCGGGTITATQATSVVSLTGATLAASGSCTFSVNVTGTSAGAKNNTTGAVTSTEGGTGGTASANLAVVAPPTITKAFGAVTVPLNGSTSLTLTIANPVANTVSLTGIAFTDNLPAGLTVASTPSLNNTCGGTATAVGGSSSVSLSGGTLAVSASCTVSVNVTGTTAGSKANTTGAISANESGTGVASNTATLTVVAPPTISKAFGAATIPLNGSTSLTLTLTNSNAGTALTGVGFTDSLPSGLVVATPNGLSNTCGGAVTATAGSASISLSGGTIASSSGCTVSVNVTGTTAGTKSNTTGAVTSTEGGTGTTSNTANLTVVAPPTITKAFGAPRIAIGGTAVLTFTINNPNTGAALTGVGFSDTLPAGLVVATPNGLSGSCGGGTITATQATSVISLSGATLAASGSCTFSVNVLGTAGGDQNNTTGNVTSTEGGTGGTASATINVIAPPTLSLAFTPTSIALNATSSLQFTITNPAANTTALNGVAFTDTLPTGLTVATSSATVCGGTLTTTNPTTIHLSGATVNQNSQCIFSVTVTGAAAGSYSNIVSGAGAITSTTSGIGATGPASNTANLTVVSPPVIIKAFGAASIPQNGTTSLTFTIQNNNTTTALTGVAFSDTLPANLRIATPNGLTGSCGVGSIVAPAGGAGITLSGGTIGASGSCTFSVNMLGFSPGTANNITGNVSSTEGGTGGTASATLKVETSPTIAKVFNPSTIALNATTSLTFTITNPAANPDALTGVAFTDTLPTGLTVVNASATVCGGTLTVTNPTSITLSGATINTNSQCQFSVTVTGAVSGQYTNTTGNVTSTNGGTGNTASANLTVAAPPTISKVFAAGTIPLNATTSLTFTIQNPNGFALTGIAFTDNLPAGLAIASTPNLSNTCGGTATAVGGSGQVSLSGGTLAASVSCSVSVDVQGTTAGVKNNSVQVTSTEGGTGNTSNASVTVVAPPVISKAFGAVSIPLNGSTSLSFTIQNNNTTTTVTGIGFSDTLPAGLVVATPNGLTAGCQTVAGSVSTAGTVTATQGTNVISLSGLGLNASGSCTFSVNVKGTSAGLQNNTTGNVTSANGGTGGTASASLKVEAPPSIAKVFNPNAIALGATTSLTFTITNPGANVDALTGVAFTDTLPTGLTVANASATVCGGTLTTTNPTSIVLSGATINTNSQCQFSVTVTGAVAGSYTNTTGNVTSTNGGTGNTASANLIVAAPPAITKSFAVGSIPLNGTTTLTFNITNPNTGAGLTGIAFTDNLPAGLTVASTPNLNNTCGGTATAVGSSSSVSLSSGTLAASTSCAVSVDVQGTTAGVKNNSVQVTSTDGGTGNTSNASITVVAPPVIIKFFGAASISVSGSTSLSFTIQNNNTTTTLTGVGFSDTLPAGLVVSTPNGLTGSCGGGTITATQSTNVVSLSGATLNQSTSCTFSVNVTGTTAGTKNNTTGNVTSTQGGTGGTASASLDVIGSADVAVTLVRSPNPAAIGGKLTFTATVTNNGPSTADVTLTETLTGNLYVVSASASIGSCSGTGPISCTLSGMASSESRQVTVIVTPLLGRNISASVTVTPDVTTPDPNNGNNSDSKSAVIKFKPQRF